VALRFRRFFVTLGVFAFAVMFCSSPMALRGVFVMFRRLGMRFLRHASSPWFELRCLLNAVSVVIVPDSTRDLFLKQSPRVSTFETRLGGRSIGTQAAPSRLDARKPRQREEELDVSLGDCFFIVALIAAALGFGIMSGTAFAAAKIIFVLALLAFLISGVVEVARRGAP
jgi:uncharacterized membrane protein YtjA (UPF0391 family)